uniref:E3 ubiquitin/ISG15 ligase TRIM25-like n=1 Tax=Astatotilapia calliptera TaxID=8154 RepID=A0A3P8R121_ASTCA
METSSPQSSVLQDELTCPVCLDLYRDPHLLPCGHNFCKTCLDRLKRQAERSHFRCPECRNSHQCSTKFQKNFKLANIADDYRHRRRVRAMPPTAPAATPAAAASMFAVKTCLKCEVSMCQEHLKPHLELPAFRMHPLTEPMNDFWKRKCRDHDEIYRYYCIDDKICVCNACTIEGGHSGHTIKTLKNTMKDLKGVLDKQLYRIERKYSMAEKKFQEQKEKERHSKKFMDDTELCLNRLGDEMKTKVQSFIGRLRDCARAHCDINSPTIQMNIIKITKDQARLQEVRCGHRRSHARERPFPYRRQLRKNMFYPEYVDMETEGVGMTMEEEMRKFLEEELRPHISDAINSLCKKYSEQDENEEEAPEEDEEEDDEDEDDLDDSSEEEMRSEGEEEKDDEEEDGVGPHDDDDYSPEEEEEEEEDFEEEEEEDGDEEEDDEERGV